MSGVLYLFSLIVGLQLSFVLYEISSVLNLNLSSNTFLLLSITIILLTCLIFYLFEKLKYILIISTINKKNTIKSIEFLEKIITKSGDKILNSKLNIRLCELYIINDNFNQALKTIKKANSHNKLFSLKEKYKLEYYLKLIYLNIILNNLIVADDEMKLAKKYFNKYMDNYKFKSDILKVKGMLEYSKGNYIDAENYINSAIESQHNYNNSDELYFILAKIYLKTQREELFERIMKQISKSSASIQLRNAAKEYLNKTT